MNIITELLRQLAKTELGRDTGRKLAKYMGLNYVANQAPTEEDGFVADLLDYSRDIKDISREKDEFPAWKKSLQDTRRHKYSYLKKAAPILIADALGSIMSLYGDAYTINTNRRLQRAKHLLSDEENFDYNMRKALKEHPEWVNGTGDPRGHFDDTYKKSNHRTFSNASQYWKAAQDYALANGLITQAAYDKMTSPEFQSWYKDQFGRQHYIPQAYQVNDPEWRKYMAEREKGVIIDKAIEGSLAKPLDTVFGNEDTVVLTPEDYNNIYGATSWDNNLATFAKDHPDVVNFVNNIDKYAGKFL